MRRLAGLAALLALAGCGARVVAPAPTGALPRVMSLNPCIDAILVQVADPVQILSISHYSHDPRATSIPLDLARRFPANSETAEEVIALRPDLVLLGAHVAPATQRAIAGVGIRIERADVPATIAQSRAQVLAVARAVGHEARGHALLARIDAALARSAPRPGTQRVPALIRMGGGLVPGKGTLADELLARTGFHNASVDHGLASWDILPLEPLIARPPRLLLSERTDRRLLAKVPGMRVAHFPDRLLQCAGPTLIEAAQRLAAIRREAGA